MRVELEVELLSGSALKFAPREVNALDPNRDVQTAIDKLDQGYKALRMWLVMQLPPGEQEKVGQLPEPERRGR